MANTYEQQLAIDSDGKNIIVSAGAGSGKTAVLTQRVIRKIMDGVDVDRLLVLTFTNEAANEMKSRIRDAIIKNKLDKQLGLLDSAYITTFDSFALSLVKKYAYTLNITKNIGIVDNNIITIYKYQVLDKIMESMYGDSEFDKLINDFCLKEDDNLKKDIIELSSKLDLQIDKEKFISEYFDKYTSEEFLNNKIERYVNIIREKIIELDKIYQEFTGYISSNLVNKLDNYFECLFKGVNYEDYHLFISMSSVKFIGVDEAGLDLKDKLKDKIEEIKTLLRFDSVSQIKDTIKDTFGYTKILLEIIKQMDLEVANYKDKYGVYEFNDIAHMAIKIVQNNKNIREEVADYFNEIMVDEYQDTSSIQEVFVNLISHNNVYMVGDIKQSIYRFRNANPYIFQDKYNRYSKNDGGMKIDLLKNFRSRKETLDNINEIFNLIMDDEIGNAEYLKEHNMIYGNTAYDLEDTGVNNKLEIYDYDKTINLEYTDYEKELFIVSEDINKKIRDGYKVFDKKSGKLRNIRYSDICIITDRNKYLDKYKKILEYKGIPSVIYMDMILTNDLRIKVIKNLISLVDYVNRGVFDNKFRYLFTSVARSFLFEYDDNAIYKLINDKKMVDDEIVLKCKKINTSEPLVRVINEILIEFNVYEKLTNLYNISEDLVRISNLVSIADNLSNLGYGLGDFSNYLDEVIEKGLLVKYSVNTSNQDAVKIMNIHKSKGLEFSLCYFTGMGNKFTIKELNEKVLFNDDLGIVLPYFNNDESKHNDTILKDIYKHDFFREEVSEKIRLFYVALTRCREKMIIVCSLDKDRIGYNKLVPILERIKYRSFLDILNSISVIDKYVVSKEAEYTHDYDLVMTKDLTSLNETTKIIKKKEIDISYKPVEKLHFSKENNKMLDIDTIKTMEYGTKIHERLEYADFKNGNDPIVSKLFEIIDKDYINIYREYEFKYVEDDKEYRGVIDLMLEYEDYINIIDYKLKNVEDPLYIKQLDGYKKYIERISNKKVFVYLYSIIDGKLKKI
ncbi:MAG: UvrD-helicase domain-containing protein [Bacilli bacterium]